MIPTILLVLLLDGLGLQRQVADAQFLRNIKDKVLPTNLASDIKEGVSSTLGNATTGLKNVTQKAQDKVEDKIGDAAKTIGTYKCLHLYY